MNKLSNLLTSVIFIASLYFGFTAKTVEEHLFAIFMVLTAIYWKIADGQKSS